MRERDGACPRLSANGRQSGINVVCRESLALSGWKGVPVWELGVEEGEGALPGGAGRAGLSKAAQAGPGAGSGATGDCELRTASNCYYLGPTGSRLCRPRATADLPAHKSKTHTRDETGVKNGGRQKESRIRAACCAGAREIANLHPLPPPQIPCKVSPHSSPPWLSRRHSSPPSPPLICKSNVIENLSQQSSCPALAPSKAKP
jgi:hypothetical protein